MATFAAATRRRYCRCVLIAPADAAEGCFRRPMPFAAVAAMPPRAFASILLMILFARFAV